MSITSHGSDDQLEAYALGRLPSSDIAELEEHLMICPVCRDRIDANEAFAVSMKEALRAVPDKRLSPFRVDWRRDWSQILRRPAVSMGFALLALIAVVSVFSNGRAKFVPVAQLELKANRGEMPVASPALQLDLRLSDAPGDGAFRVEVVNAVGQTVWSGLAAGGPDGIEVKAQQRFGPGDYFVRLYAVSGELRREYGFRLRQ